MIGFARKPIAGQSFDRKSGLRVSTALFLALAFGAAMAQDVTIPRAKQFTTGKATIIKTSEFNPQIARPGPARERPENEVEKIRIGPPNKLVAGSGFLTEDRVIPLQTKFPGISSTGWQPPDADMGVGPNHVVQVVNSSIAFFRKSDGGKTFQQDFGQFFRSLPLQTDFLFDPKAFYDPISKRFFVLCLEEDDSAKVSQLLVAVSDDSDPNGSWLSYRINSAAKVGNEDCWLDYPGFSCNKDSVLITGNLFNFAGTGAFGASFIILSKAQLLTGGSSTVTTFLDGNAFTPQTARNTEVATDRLYTLSSSFTTTQLQVHAITGLPNAPKVVSTTTAIPAFIPPQDSVRGPNGVFLDSLDPRAFTAVFRNGSLAAAQNVSVSGSDRRIATRWYEISTRGWPTSGSQPILAQSGTVVGNAGESLHMPAININKRGAISLIMSRTSSSIMADVMIASRTKTDALGKMSVPKKLAGSQGIFSFSGNRWGDYFAVAVDPVDDITFWGNAETCGSNGAWTTDIVSWKVNDIDVATIYAAQAPTVIQGRSPSGTAASLKTVDLQTYNLTTVPVTGLGQVASWESLVQTDLTAANADYLAMKFNTIGSASTTEIFFAYNWTTKAYEALTTRPIKTGVTETFEFGAGFTKYIRSDGVIKLAVRALQPPRNGTMPAAFQFKVDMIQLLGLKK